MLPAAEDARSERTDVPGTHRCMRVYIERSGCVLQPVSLHQGSVAAVSGDDSGSQFTAQVGCSVRYPFSNQGIRICYSLD